MNKERIKSTLGNFWEDEKTFLDVLPILAERGLRRVIETLRRPETPAAEVYELGRVAITEAQEGNDTVIPAAA